MKFCPNCASKVPDPAAFCPNCGAALSSGPGSPSVPPAEPVSPAPAPADPRKPLTMWHYLGLFVLSAVPVIGLVMMIVWGFGGTENVHVRNFARGALILRGIALALGLLNMYGVLRLIDTLARILESSLRTGGFETGSALAAPPLPLLL